ncbi:hypothetical protein [Timonella senegalensis]|uniref:hypothetical protein n=1 Tax=Timonella senegalensis TaxID=1465825 RepID=UPI0028B07574|nr:hypothetical protein [Timonella senegalensis]
MPVLVEAWNHVENARTSKRAPGPWNQLIEGEIETCVRTEVHAQAPLITFEYPVFSPATYT